MVKSGDRYPEHLQSHAIPRKIFDSIYNLCLGKKKLNSQQLILGFSVISSSTVRQMKPGVAAAPGCVCVAPIVVLYNQHDCRL